MKWNLVLAALAALGSSAPAATLTEGTLFRADSPEPCPLKHTAVKAEISGFIARVNVTQEFVNPTQDKIEAVYKFPLPPDSAVDSMTMLVGNRKIVAAIQRREEARRIYGEARSRGNLAGLLDQERPNIFTQSVANIGPGQTVKITIGYVETLKYEDAQFEFSFPMVVGPRYIPANLPGAAGVIPKRTPEGTRAGHDLSLEVSLDAGLPLTSLESPTHVVDTRRPDSRHATVTLKDQSTIPNRDFVLRYSVANQNIQDAVLTHSDERGGYFTLILQPPARVAPAGITPKEIVFVLDTSGSMRGFPIETAKETMKLAMDGLNPRDTFNLITFSGDEHVLFPKPVPATPANVREAQKFLLTRDGRGGTEMMKAIRAALAPSGDRDHVRIACFMTDGEVGNDFEIIHEVQQHPEARVFAFGIGTSVNHFLLDNIARHGRGEVDYVGLNDDGAAAARRFHERIRNPVLTDVSLDWGGLPVTEVYPKRIPDLFSAKPVIVTGRYSGPAKGNIHLRGKVAGQAFDRTIALDLPAQDRSHAVTPVLWARAKIDDLMGRDLIGAQDGQPGPGIRDAITRLGLAYSIMTQYTSFVAVEETTVHEPGKPPRRIEAPVEMPEGVSYAGTYGYELRAASASPAMSRFAGGRFAGKVLGGYPAVLAAPNSAWSAKISPALHSFTSGEVLVQIYLTALTEPALKKLKDLGVEITVRPQSGRIVIGKIDCAKLEALAALAEVRFVAPAR